MAPSRRKQPQAAVAVAHHLAVEVEHSAAAGAGEPPSPERCGRAVEERAEAGLGLRTDHRIGPGQDTDIQEVAGASAERDAGEHRVRGADGREERGTGDVAVRSVVDAAKVVGHGVGDVVAHAHRAGVVVRRAEVVAAIFERGERGESLRRGAGRHRDRAGSTWEDFERLVARKDQRDLVGDGVHFVPRHAIVLRLGAAGKLLRRSPWHCRDGRPPLAGRSRFPASRDR